VFVDFLCRLKILLHIGGTQLFLEALDQLTDREDHVACFATALAPLTFLQANSRGNSRTIFSSSLFYSNTSPDDANHRWPRFGVQRSILVWGYAYQCRSMSDECNNSLGKDYGTRVHSIR
jgi:hypothetical protein